MKRTIIGLFLISIAAIVVSAQASDKTIGAIRERYADISEKARLCETDDDQGSYGELVMNELTINTRNHQWRAVGIFNETYRFFYKGGDTEQHMYPDQLVFVRVERKVSSREYFEELLYDDTGRLMFYFQKAADDDNLPAERRVYFQAGKAIRVIDDGKTRDRLGKADVTMVTEIIGKSDRIKDVFVRSIKL